LSADRINGDDQYYNKYDSSSLSSSSTQNIVIPKHIGFICDGNSRWASLRNLPSAAGHAAGAERLVQILKGLKEVGVSYCTMYAFSTENWKRPEQEMREIMAVMEATAIQCASQLVREKVELRVLGDLQDERIPSSLRSVLEKLQEDTRAATRDTAEPQTLCIAINYGGRRDIVDAAKRLAILVATGEMDVKDITEDEFTNHLGTAGIPDPDLIIRTSGECRLSNFLLWNAAYAEVYFTDCLWPDFDRESLQTALHWYTSRRRRFGSRVEEEVFTFDPSSRP
jgi:undecaprenyl diphosphate synthase